MEKLYLLTLVNLETWDQQQIWVKTSCPHQWQEWVDANDFQPPLTITDPHVLRVQEFMGQLTPETDPVG